MLTMKRAALSHHGAINAKHALIAFLLIALLSVLLASKANASTYFDFRTSTGTAISNNGDGTICSTPGMSCKYVVINLGQPAAAIIGPKYYQLNTTNFNILGGGCTSGALDIAVYDDPAYTKFDFQFPLAGSGKSPLPASASINFNVPAGKFAQLIFGCNENGFQSSTIDGGSGSYRIRDVNALVYSGLPNLCIGDTPADCGATSIPSGCKVNLPVPPLPYYQFDSPWNTDIYANYSPREIFPELCPISQHATIQCFGCALTALSMALYQAGITNLSTNPLIHNDPGSLNVFMQTHIGDFDSDNNVDFINTTLDVSNSLQTTANKIFVFDHTFTKSSSATDLLRAVCTQNPSGPVPVIVKVTGTSSEHFVLVTGAESQPDGTIKFSIFDPGHADKTTLDAYDNEFKISGSVKDPTGNNSALSVSIGGNGDLTVVDPMGQRTGLDPTTASIVEQIPGSIYETDTLGSDEVLNAPTETAHSIHVQPLTDGGYTAIVTGLNLGQFTVVIRAFSQDASAQPPVLLQGIAGVGSVSTFSLQFAAAPGTTPTAARVATIQSTSFDITNSLKLGLINDQGVAKSLLQKLEAATTAESLGQNQTKVNILNAFKNELNAQSGKHITDIAVQVLMEDADSLLKE